MQTAAEKPPVTPQNHSANGENDPWARNEDGSVKLKKDGTPMLKRGRAASNTEKASGPVDHVGNLRRHAYNVARYLRINKSEEGVTKDHFHHLLNEEIAKQEQENVKPDIIKGVDEVFASGSMEDIKEFLAAQEVALEAFRAKQKAKQNR